MSTRVLNNWVVNRQVLFALKAHQGQFLVLFYRRVRRRTYPNA